MFSNPFGVNYHSLPSVCLLHFRITKNALRMEFCCNILPLTFLLPTFRLVFCVHTNNEKILEIFVIHSQGVDIRTINIMVMARSQANLFKVISRIHRVAH